MSRFMKPVLREISFCSSVFFLIKRKVDLVFPSLSVTFLFALFSMFLIYTLLHLKHLENIISFFQKQRMCQIPLTCSIKDQPKTEMNLFTSTELLKEEISPSSLLEKNKTMKTVPVSLTQSYSTSANSVSLYATLTKRICPSVLKT